MPHVFDTAPTARAKCRGCEQKIDKGAARFGERQPNAFGDGEMTLWFHPLCAAYTRPAAVLEALQEAGGTGELAAVAEPGVDDAATLKVIAEQGVAHRRLPRLRSAERASSGRARCRSCRELIAKDAWRLQLVFVDDYPFQPAGFVHAGCAQDYFDTSAVGDRLRHFGASLTESELAEIQAELAESSDG